MVGDIIALQEIFKFVHDGETIDKETGKRKVRGHFEATGVQPNCCNKMKDNGATIKQEWFRAGPCRK